MAEIIETTGKTVEDALSHALDKLGCGRAEVTYEIVQEPSGGFLGLWGKREARIRVTTRPVIPPQRMEIVTPAPPTVIAPPLPPETAEPAAAPAAPPAQQSSEDDGFGVRPRRFHTDLRSSARRASAEGASSYEERTPRDSEERGTRRTPRRSEGRPPRDYDAGGYGQRRSRFREEREGEDFRRERRERPAYDRGEAGYEMRHRERPDAQLIPLTDEMTAAAKQFLGAIFATMDLTVELHRTDTAAGTIFNMQGENLGILIGKHGSTLDALQYLTNLVVNKIPETGYARIILDVEDYRARREETLTRLAGHLADKACRIGEEIHLEPMSRHERKIIHMALQDNRRVTTYSAGDNPRRYVVIVPRRRRYAQSYDEPGYDRYER